MVHAGRLGAKGYVERAILGAFFAAKTFVAERIAIGRAHFGIFDFRTCRHVVVGMGEIAKAKHRFELSGLLGWCGLSLGKFREDVARPIYMVAVAIGPPRQGNHIAVAGLIEQVCNVPIAKADVDELIGVDMRDPLNVGVFKMSEGGAYTTVLGCVVLWHRVSKVRDRARCFECI